MFITTAASSSLIPLYSVHSQVFIFHIAVHYPNNHLEVQKAAYLACEEGVGEVTEG